MLNIIIIPAFVVAMLAVYAAAEESVLKRVGARQSTHDAQEARDRAQKMREWIDENYQEWINGDALAEDFYDRPFNRLRLWLANIIAP